MSSGQRKGQWLLFPDHRHRLPVGHSWNDRKDRCDDDDDDDSGSGSGSGNSNSNSNVVSSILILSDTTLTVDEGCNVTYTVALKSEPSDDVTVTIGDPRQYGCDGRAGDLDFHARHLG